jgi:cell division protein FtsQ
MRIKRIASWVIPILLVAVLAYIFGYSNLLKVQSVEFNNSANTPEVQNLVASPKFNIRVGAKLARVNVRGAERAISGIGWVAQSKISRDWLHGRVEISVVGRKAIASIISKNLSSKSVMDLTGTIYEDPSDTQQLPAITISDPRMAALAATFITHIPASLIAEMRNLTLTNDGIFEMEVADSNGVKLIRWGDLQNLATKLRLFEKLNSLPENTKITFLDLSDPKFPVVRD